MRQGFPIPKDIVFIYYDTRPGGLLDENCVIFPLWSNNTSL